MKFSFSGEKKKQKTQPKNILPRMVSLIFKETSVVVQSLSCVWFFSTLQHARLLYPPLSPRVCSNLSSFSRWYYLTISSSIVPFSSCFQSFLTSGFSQSIGSSYQVTKVRQEKAKRLCFIKNLLKNFSKQKKINSKK